MASTERATHVHCIWSWYPSDHPKATELGWTNVTWASYQQQLECEAHRENPPAQVMYHHLESVLRAVGLLRLPVTLVGAREAAAQIFELRRKHANRDLHITPEDWEAALEHHRRGGGSTDVMMFAAANLLKVSMPGGVFRGIEPVPGEGMDAWRIL